jgi:hypothetical protein
MQGFRRTLKKEPTVHRSLKVIAVILPCLLIALLLRGQTFPDASVYANDPVAMLAGYRHVEVSSVSDALEQLTGQRMYMTHHMQPIFTTKFAGYAITVKLVKEENHDPNALSPMLSAIDQGAKDSVYVMTVQDGADIAGMGGLMGTAMSGPRIRGRGDRWRRARCCLSAQNRISARWRPINLVHKPRARDARTMTAG